MNYIILTSEGTTYSPNEVEVENLQVLDTLEAESKEDAVAKFESENPYIISSGFKSYFAYVKL